MDDVAKPITSPPAWITAAPAVFVLLWSGGFAFAKLGLRHAEPFTFLALRYLVLVVCLVVLFALLRPPLPATRAELGHQAVVGLFIQSLYFILTYVAFVLGVSAGTFGVVVAFQPILVGLLALRVAGESVPVTRWAGLAIGMVGVVVVITATTGIGDSTQVGILCSVGALLAMTTGTFYEKRFGTEQHPVTANLVQYVVALVTCAPLALLFETMRIEWTTEFVVSLAYLVVGNSLISLTLLLAMIRAGEVSRVSALFFLVPPTAAAVAWLLVDEAMPWQAWLGMAVALAGVVTATKARSAKAGAA
ncbi:DMT family transporter [Umezawaea sp.]|uniref:DMT family transporter n=1 Tax=Umezawaea sp. TaxID=1955258 RepID=UPI002ED1EFDF